MLNRLNNYLKDSFNDANHRMSCLEKYNLMRELGMSPASASLKIMGMNSKKDIPRQTTLGGFIYGTYKVIAPRN